MNTQPRGVIIAKKKNVYKGKIKNINVILPYATHMKIIGAIG
jgi:hypothetical protein